MTYRRLPVRRPICSRQSESYPAGSVRLKCSIRLRWSRYLAAQASVHLWAWAQSDWLAAVISHRQNSTGLTWWLPVWNCVNTVWCPTEFRHRTHSVNSVRGRGIWHHCFIRPWMSFLCVWYAGLHQCSCYRRWGCFISSRWMCRTPRPVDEYEQTKAEHRENPADLARHSTAARQAHGDATPTDYVSCRVRLSGYGPWRRSGQSAIHMSAGHCRFPILLLPVALATRCTTISDRGRIEIVGTSIYTLRMD